VKPIVIRTLAAAIIASAIFVVAQTGKDREAELKLLESLNRARQQQGLPGLRWNNELAAAARKHAVVMARHGSAEHAFPGEPSLAGRVTQAGVKFSWLAENVCQGARADAIDAEFMNSPKHRANILDSDMNSVGIGVAERGGQLYAVEDFAKVK
jgi:uncharacterized protein YkwD